LDFYGGGFALHRPLDPSSGLCGSEREYSGDHFTDYRVEKFVPLPRDMEELDGSSVPAHHSGLCGMGCPGVLPLSLDGILVYRRLPLVFVRLPSQFVSAISTPWRGEVLGGLGVLPGDVTQ